MIYHITPAQIAAAEQAEQEFAEILTDDPYFRPPASFRQLILNEERGWTWNVAAQKYEPENK